MFFPAFHGLKQKAEEIEISVKTEWEPDVL
jgi:hypothetical protein